MDCGAERATKSLERLGPVPTLSYLTWQERVTKTNKKVLEPLPDEERAYRMLELDRLELTMKVKHGRVLEAREARMEAAEACSDAEVARETTERAREAFAREVERARSAFTEAAEEAEERAEYERYRAETAQARAAQHADSESAHARLAARLAEINVARDRAMAEDMQAFDREATRDRLAKRCAACVG